MPDSLSIASLRAAAKDGPLAGALHAQVDDVCKKDSSNGKPYFEVKLRDATDSMILRAWSDSAAFDACSSLTRGEPVEVEGEFLINGTFGLDARRWRIRPLDETETAALFEGPAEAVESRDHDFSEVTALVETITDPRLLAVCRMYLSEHGARFQRAAAARMNHHAHRGGLLRHTAQMMRMAAAAAGLYPMLNRDLLLAGTLFHDSGKLWEMCPPERGFDMPRELRGELLGHISIGIELVNALWRKLPLEEWKDLKPASDEVRLHLLHVIASHHGELQFGSPVEPKTPEAAALHFIDNLDARLEMFANAYAKSQEIAPGILDRVRPLNTSPVVPLKRFGPPC